MTFVYDVILNFEYLKYYYDIYEWKKDDYLINIKKIPIYRVGNKVIIDILNNDIKVSSSFLKNICNKCIISKKEKYSYVVIFSNGEKCIGICFNDKGFIMYKSALLLDEEKELNKVVSDMKIYELKYKVLGRRNNRYLREDSLIIKYVINNIKRSYKNKEYDKLKYLYYDLFGNIINDNKVIYNRLINIDNYYNKLDKAYNFFKIKSLNYK